MDTLSLAKNMIREIQATDSNFSGKVAKISGHALNKKDAAETLNKMCIRDSCSAEAYIFSS